MTPRGQHTTPTAAAAGTSSAAAHDDQDLVTLDGVRDAFFVAHRACERFSKVLGGIAQKLQDSKADDPWLTEVCAGVGVGWGGAGVGRGGEGVQQHDSPGGGAGMGCGGGGDSNIRKHTAYAVEAPPWLS